LLRYPNVKVLAIGLEDALEPWQSTAQQFPNFEHALALDKWESAYAKTYAIQSTPTYIFLDERKRILSKPSTYQEVLSQLKAMQGQ
jgi:predicted house-cleaning NTP pyrophosphatase (Maf/HAM1 superfamily)